MSGIGSVFNFYKNQTASPLPISNEELLQKAIESKDCAIHNLEISSGPLPNGELPLHYAIRKGCHDIVAILLKKGCNIDEQDSHGLTPTDHALISDDARMQALVFGCRLNIPHENILPLINDVPKFIWMGGQRNSEMYRQAIERTQKTINYIIRSCTSSMCGLSEIPGAVYNKEFSKITKITNREIPGICEAAYKQEYSKVLDCITQGVDINATMPNGWSALYYAVQQGKTEVVSVLLNKGAKIDLSESAGFSALHLAAAGNNIDMVELLLKAGADPSVKDKQGIGSLTYAMTNESLATAKFLLKYSDVTFSDIEILLCNSRHRTSSRDQMGIKWNRLQWMLASTLAMPLFASIIEAKNPESVFIFNCAATIIPSVVVLANTKGWKQKTGAITLLAMEAIPGINVGVKFAAHAYRTWLIGKESLSTLGKCWQHRHLETLRPLCNGIIGSLGAAYSLSSLINVTQGKDWKGNRDISCRQHNKIANDKAVKAGKTTYETIECEKYINSTEIAFDERAEKFSNFYTFTNLKTKTFTWVSNLLGFPTPGESAFWKKEFTGEVSPDLCKDKELGVCIREADLKGNIHPSQSMAILGLSEGYSIQNCTKVAKQLFLKYHPDKLINPDPLVFGEVMTAREYLCQNRHSYAFTMLTPLGIFSRS